MSEADVHAYTVRLELVDEPGELLRALEPIADNGDGLERAQQFAGFVDEFEADGVGVDVRLAHRRPSAR